MKTQQKDAQISNEVGHVWYSPEIHEKDFWLHSSRESFPRFSLLKIHHTLNPTRPNSILRDTVLHTYACEHYLHTDQPKTSGFIRHVNIFHNRPFPKFTNLNPRNLIPSKKTQLYISYTYEHCLPLTNHNPLAPFHQ